MTEEINHLKEYRDKLSELTKEDIEKRDEYLVKMTKGEILGPQTGYATIDQPWKGIFNIEELHKIKNNKTVYQDIYDKNVNNNDSIAIMFFGAVIKYKKLFSEINNTVKAFSHLGVKKGDYITVCAAGIPETIYSFYAGAKMGAPLNMMAPYFDKDQMIERIKDCNSKVLVVMDTFYPKIKDAIDKSTIEKVVVIPTLNSSILRFLKPSKKINDDKVIYWNDLIKKSKNEKMPGTFYYEPNYPVCMVYSSGTTGASKAIVLTHDSFQNSVLSYNANTYKLKSGEKIYQIIPPWYSTGLNTCIHLPLHSGMTVFQDPRFERKVFVNNIIKYKLDYSIAPTSMYEGFLDPTITKGRKIKELKYPFEGGEALTPEVKHNIEEKFKDMGCNSSLLAGYGQCECGAQVTIQHLVVDHPEKSVGLPIPGVTIGIFDDNYNELPYYSRGNVLVDTPCGMKGYYNNKEANDEYFYIDKYGIKWNCTGDIGYIYPTGDLVIEGRASDYSIVNNNKIYNFDIENIVSKIDNINNNDCLQMNNDNPDGDLALHIIFDKNNYSDEQLKEVFFKIQITIFEQTNNIDMVPQYFKIRNSFPYKPSGKRDIEQLLQEKDDFIFMDKNELKSKEYCLKKSKR